MSSPTPAQLVPLLQVAIDAVTCVELGSSHACEHCGHGAAEHDPSCDACLARRDAVVAADRMRRQLDELGEVLARSREALVALERATLAEPHCVECEDLAIDSRELAWRIDVALRGA